MFRWAMVMSFVVGGSAAAADVEWETVATEPIVIRTRAIPGTDVKEIWAEGEMAAPAQDVQTAVMNADRFSQFMPYVKESRTLGQRDQDGGQFVYTRLELPWVSSRDYVVRVNLLSSVSVDGTGEFKNRWEAAPDHIPTRANVIRLRVNEGSWHVVPRGPNKSYAVYRFMVDPGGWIPTFAANAGNKQGVTDTFKAVEKEAQRVAEERGKQNEAAWRH